MSGQSSLHSLYRLDHEREPVEAPDTGAAARRLNPSSLLLTKLQPPRLPRDVVPRPRLVSLMGRVLDCPLTLVSAPTGFGKSTLVAQALAEVAAPCAWLAIDEHDDDLYVFLDYLIATIQTLFPDACPQTRRLLGALQAPPVETLAAALVNEIQAIATPFIVVIDDFHYLTDGGIRDFFATLLRAIPTSLHLVVIAQRDPAWPLARLAGRGQLLEIRATDLRFRPDEARTFLERALGAGVSADTLEFLVQHTDGWIVALRLAVLSLGREPDRAATLRELKPADDHFAPRFLVQGVLARRSPAVREFLLRTSILDRLSAPLCAALLADAADVPTVQDIAVWLRDTNLFIVPLGAGGEWYGYHALFRDLLRRELAFQCDSECIAGLHRRASAWLSEHGFAEEALRHALAAGDTDRAADIVESQVHAQLNREAWRGVERSLALLPADIVRQRPSLLLAQAWVLGLQEKLSAVLALAQAAEALIGDAQAPLSEAQRTSAQAEIALFRAYVLLFRQNGALASVDLARQALASLPHDYFYARGLATHCEGLALYLTGRHAEGIDVLWRVVDAPDEPAVVKMRPLIALLTIYRIAVPLFALEQALDLYLKLAVEYDFPLSTMWARYLLGSLHYERNELEQATEQFEMVLEQRYLAHQECVRQSLAELALTFQAQGRPRQADAAARDLAQASLGVTPDAAAHRSIEVRLALGRGDVQEALRRAAGLPLVPPAAPMTLTDVPAITHAQALLAGGGRNERQRALELLDALEKAAEATHTLRPLVRILALQALGLVAERRDGEALAKVERAVALAEPMGLIRTFVDVGPALVPLLQRLLKRDVPPVYLREVLAAFAAESRVPTPETLAKQGALIEPLTEREMEVLRMLSRRLSNKEIAADMGIATGTAKRHVGNVFGKLGVHSRRQAVQRAQALGLLPTH